jgi:transcriptional regulator with XRE-family HTH domain
MASLKIEFGKKLKIIRKQAGLTQEQLAENIGVSIESISNMERGLHSPSFNNLEKIAVAINVKVKELFEFN